MSPPDDGFAPPPAPAGLGHNNPPAGPLLPEQVTAYLDDTEGAILRRRAELVAAVDTFLAAHPTIDDDHVQEAATDTLEMLRKLLDLAKKRHTPAKAPYLHGGRAVDAWFNAFAAGAEEARDRLRAPAKAYAERLEAERKAKAAAEAKRAAEEAARAAALAQQQATAEAFDRAIAVAQQADEAATLAAGKAHVHSRTTTLYGATSSLREKWTWRVVDPAKVERHLCMPADALIRAAVNAGLRQSPGLEIVRETDLRTRS